MKKEIFLLGGYDLEMLTIKKLLIKHNKPFIDKQLFWGASLSAYHEELSYGGIIYGIELQEDIQPPANYISIDHHGSLPSEPTSLEQVAEILNISLSFEERLIAKNDCCYIKGMLMLGASKEQVAAIRLADRKAQGVSENDEKLAAYSVKMSSECFIFSYTNHFSPVVDRIYGLYKEFLIYNKTKIVFYNYSNDAIIRFLGQCGVKKEQIYFGGAKKGFVGVMESALSFKKIVQIVNNFKGKECKKKL
ncbi:hypothetical protein LCX93_04865 [Sulfurimonas sp. SWIR-19]|uniref:hypothetical protein n=1 Tax=Sulfurimonas sp. SWIR-19 TaxID=2878390 RepID=UPI001CF1323F|nr:hypothetical protein [Sulfurimonas sp. SWIR-19]UCN01249.1 hypothetical protein LCX93_04865 [Sulfurimonas sp. SWIR-19]